MMEPSTSYSPSTASSSSSWDETKLFVGGISRETTKYWLVKYFSKYGEVAWANVVENKITSGSRGFAFVRFVDSAATQRALADTRQHIISGSKVEVKKAIPKYHGYQNHQHLHANQYQDRNGELINSITNSHNGIPFNLKKIFVGGLPLKLTEDEFCSFFKQFGEIKDAVLIYNNLGRLRGFGFIEFHSVEAAEKVLQNRFYELKEKNVEVKRAVPKNANNYNKEINTCFSEHMIADAGAGYVFDNGQAGFYPRYGGLQDYVSLYFRGHTSQYSGGFVGEYSIGCYDYSPYPDLRSLLNSQELVPTWQSLMPYGNTSLYRGYMNLLDLRHDTTIWCSDNSNNGNEDQNLSDLQSQNVDDSIPQLDDKDGNSAEQLYSYCNENGKQNFCDMQSQNVEDRTPHSDGDNNIAKPDTTPQHDEDEDGQLAIQQYSNRNSNGNEKQNLSDMQSQYTEDITLQADGDNKTSKPDDDGATPQCDEEASQLG